MADREVATRLKAAVASALTHLDDLLSKEASQAAFTQRLCEPYIFEEVFIPAVGYNGLYMTE